MSSIFPLSQSLVETSISDTLTTALESSEVSNQRRIQLSQHAKDV
jgi:hypothetical protein